MTSKHVRMEALSTLVKENDSWNVEMRLPTTFTEIRKFVVSSGSDDAKFYFDQYLKNGDGDYLKEAILKAGRVIRSHFLHQYAPKCQRCKHEQLIPMGTKYCYNHAEKKDNSDKKNNSGKK